MSNKKLIEVCNKNDMSVIGTDKSEMNFVLSASLCTTTVPDY